VDGGAAIERVRGVEVCCGERSAPDTRIGEQRSAERSAADGARHVPGAGQIAWREYAVGENDGHVVGDQQHLAHPGALARRQVDQTAFVGEGAGANFSQHLYPEAVATGDDARGERADIDEPRVQKCGSAKQGGVRFPVGELA